MNKFNRWLRSKQGLYSIIGLVAVLVLVVVLGQLAGWWNIAGGPGAAGLPPAQYDAPPGGYTCLPTCDETDGRFLALVSARLKSFAGEKIVLWIAVPGNYTEFELDIFDGDSGEDNNGNLNWTAGNWDGTYAEATFALYADPFMDGTGTTLLQTWRGNQDNMPNNAWFTASVANSSAAQAPSQHYFYRLEITQPVDPVGINRFKIRSNGYLIGGSGDSVNASLAIVGGAQTMNDIPILYPEYTGDINNLGPSTYSGEWKLYFYIPNRTDTLEFWDGDFDHGSAARTELDTDDPNTEGKPEWASSYAVPEREAGVGAPPDDTNSHVARRSPAVWYQLIDPVGAPIYVNDNPSGTEEWELFTMSNDATVMVDSHVDEIKEGFYTLHIVGLDMGNTVWVRMNFMLVPYCEDGPCKPPQEWMEGTCPRTIGYWKNNVKKVLIENKTRGVQESRATLEWGLNNVALASPLFRSGLNATNPVAITTVARLTDAEANAILQKVKGNSMLDRALQQNLATWLNLGTGKLGPTTVIHLVMPSGNFDGTVWEALQTAQNIILYERTNAARLEYAKDIADMINNNQLNADPNDILACSAYEQIIPPAEQPPAYEDMPEGPLPPEPPNPTPEPTPDPATCGVRVNNYGVESPTNNPFYGIKFEYQSGTEVKNGNYEEFKITLPADAVAAMTSVQLEAKAAGDVGLLTLEGCDFTSPLACGEPTLDPNGYFAFYFMGAVDNGDGTYTLTFWVQNQTNHGLSHATIGLPAGVVPTTPTNNYQSEVCPVE